MKYYFLILSVYFISQNLYSQNALNEKWDYNSNYFISFSSGYQMSGIKEEDFKFDNYSPVLIIEIGKWLNSSLGVQIGFRGFYFYYIMDEIKHYYNFVFVEGLLDINNLLKFNKAEVWDIILHFGGGYFYNITFKRSNLYANFGIINTVSINSNFKFIMNISAVIGNKIYQNNLDILPSISVGLVYSFNFN